MTFAKSNARRTAVEPKSNLVSTLP